MTTRIILCRHGVTALTESGRWDGRGGLNPPLNDTGRAQAAYLAARASALLSGSGPVRVFSSTLERAVQTAAPVAAALGVEPCPDPVWDELAFGEWDGRSGHELRTAHPDLVERFWHDETFRPPGGESHTDLHARVRPAFQALLDAGGTTVVVSHWGPIMSVFSLLLGLDLGPARRLAFAPASMSGVSTNRFGPVVEFINDLGALPASDLANR
ncbi:MAG: histidine phosphatase family protein [Propionibacteriaceae bacterium]|nr:histidine phosphatase family protein [Propionibacteriaceae bacterium]